MKKSLQEIATPKVNCKYGAPMGRADLNPERHERLGKIHDCYVDICAGGYDRGGAYWGIANPREGIGRLRVLFSECGKLRVFYREGDKVELLGHTVYKDNIVGMWYVGRGKYAGVDRARTLKGLAFILHLRTHQVKVYDGRNHHD